MDTDAFAIAARNLIDNAINHGPEGREIEVIAGEGVVRVVNGGPVVPASVLVGLKERFARGDTRSSGTGLGLAIVDSLMTQAGGRLELYSPAEGRSGGFEAKLILAGSWTAV
jgi:two-component system OmpR family sensor kinase